MKIVFAFVFLFLATFAQVDLAWSRTIPLEDFFRNPMVAGFEVSPGGTHIAYLKSWEGRLNIHVRKIGAPESEEKRLSSVKDRDIRDYFWKGNDNVFYLKDFGGDENFHLFRVNIKTGEEKDLTPYENTRVGITDDLRHVDDNALLVSHNKRDAKVFDVYRLNLRTNKMEMILKNPGDVDGYVTDQKGRVRIAIKSEGTDTVIMIRDGDKGEFKPLLRYDYNHSFNPYLFSADGTTFYATSNLGRDTEALIEYDIKNKREKRILYQRSDYDLQFWGDSPVIYSYKQKRPVGVRYQTWRIENSFFDPEFESIFNRVAKELPNSNLMLTSIDKAENKMIFTVNGDRSRGTFYLFDRSKDTLEKVGEAAPWLKPEELAEMRPIQFRSRDGLNIHGYVVLPKGYKDGQRIPFIVNPHGGPWARDLWRFNSEAQFLANRGFGIMQINFRGSTGYGKEFLKASYKQWGLTMQDDVTDGTHWLVNQGYADKKKICIYGGSYGGYATLMGLVKEPDLYACGVDFVGVSNLFTFMKTIPPYWEPFRAKLYAMVGDPEKDKDQMIRTSPALNVDRIKKPLFIAQGAKDPRVNKDESDQMVKNLKARGIEVPYMVKENEGHGFGNQENRFEFYQAMEKFLNKHLK